MNTNQWLQELIQELNNLNQELNNSESPIGKIDALLTTKHPGTTFLIQEYETALKTCDLSYLDPKVDRLRKALEDLKQVQKDPN